MADRDTPASQPTNRVGIREFRGNFSTYMRQVRQGSSFVVTSRDEVVAIIQPPYPTPPLQRKAGTLRGKIRMGEGFDTLPIDIIAAMEGDGE